MERFIDQVRAESERSGRAELFIDFLIVNLVLPLLVVPMSAKPVAQSIGR